MKRLAGVNSLPEWVQAESDARAIAYDGTYWTVRRYNRTAPALTPICKNPTPETVALYAFLQNFEAGQLVGVPGCTGIGVQVHHDAR